MFILERPTVTLAKGQVNGVSDYLCLSLVNLRFQSKYYLP